MKTLLACFIFFAVFVAKQENCFAQTGNARIMSHDSTPIEDLDYHLSREQFISYYGIDDTSKAIINMFYRERGLAGIDFALIPGLSCIGGYINRKSTRLNSSH